MSYTADTRTAPVQYGRAYLDDAQLAAQMDRQRAIESGTVLYGSKYRPEPETLTPELTPPTSDTPEPPALLTIAALRERLVTATADEVDQYIGQEAHRPQGPRKVALQELLKAAVACGMTERAEQVRAALAELEG